MECMFLKYVFEVLKMKTEKSHRVRQRKSNFCLTNVDSENLLKKHVFHSLNKLWKPFVP